jgi:hypothetical protein
MIRSLYEAKKKGDSVSGRGNKIYIYIFVRFLFVSPDRIDKALERLLNY